MKKLIKLSDTHYIIVDDTEIKEGDFYITEIPQMIYQYFKTKGLSCSRGKNFKIIYSNQPLEYIHIAPKVKGLKLGFKNIKQLSLSEVEEVINGYNLEEMVGQSFENMGYHSTVTSHEENQFKLGYKLGFKAHQELVKDKMFTVEDIKKAIQLAQDYTVETQYDEFDVLHEILKHTHSEKMIIQSLLPKTEWDIEINEQNKITLL